MAGGYLAEAIVAIRGDGSKLKGDVESSTAGIGGDTGKRIAAGIGASMIGAGTAFSGFDQQMREVFTLMPGVSGDAMSQMTDQTLGFAKEFGTLPQNVIPALYDSLSAGVPADNVFSFLETSQKFATAGATDVGTAVDGLSTTVNAFGLDASEAGDAADSMFTAVRLGKTTVEQLSGAMFQVAPIAANLGVSVDEVSAGFASLTAQGVPTSVAATQMKGAFSELAKTGSVADKAFRDIAGQGFSDFIAGGGDVQTAFNMMRSAADEAGIPVTDMFGSIEAGQAVLGLTGANAERFATNLEAMGQKAGAVDEAFETMNQGIGPAFNRLKATLMAGTIELGNAIAPGIIAGLELILKYMPMVKEGMKAAFGAIIAAVGPPVQAIAGVIGDLVQKIAGSTPILIGLGVAIGVGLAAYIAGAIPGVLAYAASWAAAAASVIIANAPIVAIGVAITALVAGLVWAYQNVDIFRNAVDAVASFLTGTVWPALQQLGGYLAGGFAAAWSAAIGFIQGSFIPAMRTVGTFLTGTLWPILKQVGEFLGGVFAAAWGVLSSVVSAVVPVLATVAQFVGGTLWSALQLVAGFLSGAFSVAWTAISTVVGAVVTAFQAVAGFVTGTLVPAFQSFLGFITGTLVPGVQSIGAAIAAGFAGVSAAVAAALEGVKAAAVAVFEFIKARVVEVLNAMGIDAGVAWQVISTAAQTAMTMIQTVISTAWAAITTVVQTAMTVISTIFSVGWMALSTIVQTAMTVIQTVFQVGWTVIQTIVQTAMTLITTAITVAWPIIQTIVQTAMTVIQTAIQVGWTIISTVVQTAMTLISTIIQTGWQLVLLYIQTVSTIITTIIQTAWTLISTIIQTAMTLISTIIQTAWTIIQTVIQTAMTLITTIIQTGWTIIQTIIQTAMTLIQTVITVAWTAIQTAITVAMTAIQTFLSTTWEAIKTNISTVVEAIRAMVVEKFEAIRAAISEKVEAIRAMVAEKFEAMRALIVQKAEAIRAAVVEKFEAVRAAIAQKVEAIRAVVAEKFEAIRAKATEVAEQIRAQVIAKFEALKSGVVGPIESAKSTIVNAFNAMLSPVQGVIDKIQGLLDIISRIPTSISLPSIPGAGSLGSAISGLNPFSQGGYVTRPTAALIGEDGPELVLPLTKPRRMMELLGAAPGGSSMLDGPGLFDGSAGGRPLSAPAPTVSTSTQNTVAPVYNFYGVSLETALSRARRDESRRTASLLGAN